MTPREAARLMGLPDAYALPRRATEAFHLVGDGVAALVVRFLSENLLLPLVQHRLEGDPTFQAKSA
jgi:DNA (cytosine-5)-methyltransferase 1